jgi:3-(3-hydroxy-phenyl)propionate hydroxylase
MRFKPKPRFHSGFFVGKGGLAQRLGGAMFAQPWVERGNTTMRLDDVLGPGFACLCYGGDPAALADKLGDLPSRLAAAIVHCLPRTLAFPATTCEPLIRDSSGEIGALLRVPEAIVVLRPDRYVAAAMTPDEIAGATRALREAIAQTFAVRTG